jgi:hypothetical protein
MSAQMTATIVWPGRRIIDPSLVRRAACIVATFAW